MTKAFSCLKKGRKIIEGLAELLVIGLMGCLCLYLLGSFYFLYQFSLLPKIPEKSWLPHLDTPNWHSQLYSWLSGNDKAGPHQLFYSFLTCSERTKNLNILCQLQVHGRCKTHQPAEVMDSLWVVAPVYAYDQETTVYLYQLHDSFRSYIESFGLPLCTIEGIRKDKEQSYLLTQPEREPFDIQVQIYDEDYIRENLINVALNKIPSWEYVAWIDGHQVFDNLYWWEETIVKIEREKTIQLYQKLTRYNLRNQSFLYKDGIVALSLYQTDLDSYRGGVMPEYGGALAIRKEVYDQLGSILDICIGAGCDLTFIRASLPNTHSFVILQKNAPYYAANFDNWLIHARSVINASRATVRGTLHHFEHEHHFEYDAVPKAYQKAGFNPRRDLARDENGTIVIINPKIKNIVPGLNVGWSISK